MTGFLPGLSSLLRHPLRRAHEQLRAAKQGLMELEERVVANMTASITDRVLAIEEQLLAVERRVEDNVRMAIRERLEGIEGQLATVKARVVDDLKRELRHLLLHLALAAGAAGLALVGAGFLLGGAWLALMARFGATAASFALGVALLTASLVPIGILRSAGSRG